MYNIVPACVAALMSVSASAALSSADRDFAMKAASGGLAEVQTGQLAQQRAGSGQVRQFGARMVTDHTKANDELQQIAQQENIDLPSQPTRKAAAESQRLSGLNGAEFDRSYAEGQVRNHQEDIVLFRREANSGKDPALKAFAQKMLPVLQQHLQFAQALTRTR